VLIAIAAVSAVTVGTMGVGARAVRYARTTSDLMVASRTVSPWWNAAAISGEYLSAASFLGIAGLALAQGASALWLPLGFTAGYLLLLLFVAAPLRRFGAYTIPDFAEARLESPRLRLLAALIVLLIGSFYLLPQLKGAGIALEAVAGLPYWVGVLSVAIIVASIVALGGMRGITYVQALQFAVKIFAIALPASLLLIHLGGLPDRSVLFGSGLPHAGPHGLSVALHGRTELRFPRAGSLTIAGRPVHVTAGERLPLGPGTLVLPAGEPVPTTDGITAVPGRQWDRPITSGGSSSPLYVYSLLVATFLGTMGLPHILVRFYTNPDGHAARLTTVRVLALLGAFYCFPAVYGALGRVLDPRLYITGQTDSVVLLLPQAAWPGVPGQLLGAITAAGAFAAFLSTSSGLLVSLAGGLSHDLWTRFSGGGSLAATAGAPPVPPPVAVRRRRFRLAAVGAMLIPAAVACLAQSFDISMLVGWAFALAASTFCPLFLLGIWWQGLTARGAAAGMIAGVLLTTGGILAGVALGEPGGAGGALLAQPAVVSVPIAFLVMIGVSLRGDRPPAQVEALMLALHAPEGLGLSPREREDPA
jgi:cation/acetate symporter